MGPHTETIKTAQTIPNETNDDNPGPSQRRSGRNRKPPARLIETHMVLSDGVVHTHLFLTNHNLFVPRKPDTELTGMHTIAMTQYSMKTGLKKFGDDGVKAVLSEMEQIDTRKVLLPVSRHDLTDDDRRNALKYLMFLKEKRSGKIKGRGCADGRKQRATTKKKDAASPTVALESLLLSCVIDAKERRHVATTGIPGAFMQADMDERVHVRFRGIMARLLVQINPQLYRKHVCIEKGEPVLYAELAKALYGTLRAAILFWEDLTSTLTEWGFVLNPHDSCVANKIIKGKQCTIVWHVDDQNISHVDKSVVKYVVKQLNGVYGKETPLVTTYGKIHDYLGMKLDYIEDGFIKIDMCEYVAKILDEVPDEMRGTATTPAGTYLFDVDESTEQLTETKAQFFYYVTAKLLFLCKRARPNIQTAISFLCTRVKSPDHDDYKKLCCVIKYLDATKELVLRLSANDPLVIKWWTDASFAVHRDMKSHTVA